MIKIIQIKLFVLLSFFCSIVYAQNFRFATSGVIEYEKRVNMYAVMPRFVKGSLSQQNITEYKKTQPQFLIAKSLLSFYKEKTLFEPIENISPNYYNNDPAVTQNNIVFTDLKSRLSITQKNAFGELLLIKDTARVIKWKITEETREIAGFSCRRANALIMDSIYVVAFYTSEIPVSGGPESFTGLPGMILQISLPHENITWIAKKVVDKNISIPNPPSKGKIMTYKELHDSLMKALQRYGGAMQTYLKSMLL